MSAIRTIAMLTAGGDAPGMNAVVRAVTRSALALGMRVIGAKRGYEGLTRGVMNEMGARDVGGIIQRGGTFCRPRVFPSSPSPRCSARRCAS